MTSKYNSFLKCLSDTTIKLTATRINMAGLRRNIATVIGVSMAIFVVANVQFGMVAPQLIDGAETSKLDVLKMLEPHCAISEIEQELAEGNDSFCLGNAGDWNGADLLLLAEGLFMIFVGKFRFPQQGRWAKRFRRLAFIGGCTLFGLAILDRLELLPTSVSSKGIASLIPLDVSPLAVQLGMAIIGAYMMRGPKYWESEVANLTTKRLEKRRKVADKFRSKYGTVDSPLAELHGKQQRVARSPLMHRDSKLTMKSNNSLNVQATCPYCDGAGCEKCDFTGSI
tara:strand:- start:21934 stop:22782 length:849 start_codon:yes stop_codon:yes gene_type:complete